MLSRLINGIVLSGMVFILLINVNTGLSQEWSKEQQMVWKNVEAYWKLYGDGNLEGFLGYMHDGYLGWNVGTPLPSGKADAAKWMKHFWAKRKVTIYDVNPVGIAVFGDVAIVHYYYTMMVADEEGKEKNMSGNWTDVLLKQGDKWLLIGDHGGNQDDD